MVASSEMLWDLFWINLIWNLGKSMFMYENSDNHYIHRAGLFQTINKILPV